MFVRYRGLGSPSATSETADMDLAIRTAGGGGATSGGSGWNTDPDSVFNYLDKAAGVYRKIKGKKGPKTVINKSGKNAGVGSGDGVSTTTLLIIGGVLVAVVLLK